MKKKKRTKNIGKTDIQHKEAKKKRKKKTHNLCGNTRKKARNTKYFLLFLERSRIV